MYANLRVTQGDDFVAYAHEIVIVGPHAVEVHKDANDGESYAVPDGVVRLDPDTGGAIRVTADF